jgi:hypothetical protein
MIGFFANQTDVKQTDVSGIQFISIRVRDGVMVFNHGPIASH